MTGFNACKPCGAGEHRQILENCLVDIPPASLLSHVNVIQIRVIDIDTRPPDVNTLIVEKNITAVVTHHLLRDAFQRCAYRGYDCGVVFGIDRAVEDADSDAEVTGGKCGLEGCVADNYMRGVFQSPGPSYDPDNMYLGETVDLTTAKLVLAERSVA
jgi:hypothetical protein